MVCIGTLDTENTVDMKIGIRKRLTILFSYGGLVADVKEVLDLIAEDKISPQVETGHLTDFSNVLKDLHAGKIPARMALIPQS